jgi:hypothetical protein
MPGRYLQNKMDTNKLILAAIILNIVFGIVQGVQMGSQSKTVEWLETFSTKGNSWTDELKESDNLIVKSVGDFVEKALNIIFLGFKVIAIFFAILIPAILVYTQPTLVETYIINAVAIFVTVVNFYVIIELYKIWRNKKT